MKGWVQGGCRLALPVLLVCLLSAVAPRPGLAQTCDEEFDGTFDLIQQAIFVRRGCTTALCHDSGAAGGLDLSPGVAYQNLVDVPVESIVDPLIKRVVPAKKELSLLWLNVASAVDPEQWTAPLRSMPQGGLPPLTIEELTVLQLWIEHGAPREGVVPGTGELLDACLPAPEPLETKPLDPPPPGEGVQLRAPRQVLPPQSEREVCFVTYYDLTDQVPEKFRGPNGDTFRYKRIESRQDPVSHHAVVIPYFGGTPLDSPIWGAFRCGGGVNDGQECNPRDLSSCGDDGVCGSTPTRSVACIGYGPGDASIGVGNDSLFNTMAAGLAGVEGVYAEAPLAGVLVWNSHAYNTTDEPAKLDIWVNLEFAAPEEQLHPLQRFTEVTAQFGLNVAPFGAQQICSHYVVPRNAHILELSSHNHKRGELFEIFEGKFACAGGPSSGKACSPFGPDPTLPLDDLCSGAPCTALQTARIGDCNHDLSVSLDELITGLNVALGKTAMSECPRFDPDGDGAVVISDLVSAVDAAIGPRLRDADSSLLYTSFTYADPVVVKLDPPLLLGGQSSFDVERTLTFCGIYDNGARDPSAVKRLSTSPTTTAGFPGGPCPVAQGCTEGNVGARCLGVDSTCDSSPGAGDGVCDACPLRFGVTTEDEMFILLGAFYTN